jgi:phosphoribosyl-AMP cyclohydrolase
MTNIQIDFNKDCGLIPTIIQDVATNQVLILGYMNAESLQKTQETGWVYFWSRSRQRLWLKGEKSGNRLRVISIQLDCDGDTLLVKTKLVGTAACHTGQYSCFFTNLSAGKI